MMVESADGKRALLGRSRGHRPGMLTCLAGFVDQCESVGVPPAPPIETLCTFTYGGCAINIIASLRLTPLLQSTSGIRLWVHLQCCSIETLYTFTYGGCAVNIEASPRLNPLLHPMRNRGCRSAGGSAAADVQSQRAARSCDRRGRGSGCGWRAWGYIFRLADGSYTWHWHMRWAWCTVRRGQGR